MSEAHSADMSLQLQYRDKRVFELEGALVRQEAEALAANETFAEKLRAQMAEVQLTHAGALLDMNQKYIENLQEERRQTAVLAAALAKAQEAVEAELASAFRSLDVLRDRDDRTQAILQKYRQATAADFTHWIVQKTARP